MLTDMSWIDGGVTSKIRPFSLKSIFLVFTYEVVDPLTRVL